MDNGRGYPSNAPTIPHPIPHRSAAMAPGQFDRPSSSTAVRFTRRGQIVRSTFIVVAILFAALVAGLVVGGITGVI